MKRISRNSGKYRKANYVYVLMTLCSYLNNVHYIMSWTNSKIFENRIVSMDRRNNSAHKNLDQ